MPLQSELLCPQNGFLDIRKTSLRTLVRLAIGATKNAVGVAGRSHACFLRAIIGFCSSFGTPVRLAIHATVGVADRSRVRSAIIWFCRVDRSRLLGRVRCNWGHTVASVDILAIILVELVCRS